MSLGDAGQRGAQAVVANGPTTCGGFDSLSRPRLTGGGIRCPKCGHELDREELMDEVCRSCGYLPPRSDAQLRVSDSLRTEGE